MTGDGLLLFEDDGVVDMESEVRVPPEPEPAVGGLHELLRLVTG